MNDWFLKSSGNEIFVSFDDLSKNPRIFQNKSPLEQMKEDVKFKYFFRILYFSNSQVYRLKDIFHVPQSWSLEEVIQES